MEIRCNRDGREHWKEGQIIVQDNSEQHLSHLFVISFMPARSMSKLGSLTPSLLNERLHSYNSTHFISSTPLWFYSCQTPGLATSTWAPSPYPQVAPPYWLQTLGRCSTPRYGARQSSLMAMLSSGFQTSQVEYRRWARKRSAQIVTAECWTPLTLMSVPPKRKIKEIEKNTKDDLYLCCLHFFQDGDRGIFLLQ